MKTSQTRREANSDRTVATNYCLKDGGPRSVKVRCQYLKTLLIRLLAVAPRNAYLNAKHAESVAKISKFLSGIRRITNLGGDETE